MSNKEKFSLETAAYRCYKRYHDNFFVKSNLSAFLSEVRNFVGGRQYTFQLLDGEPKPTFNITREYVEKVTAKLLETKHSVGFIADMADESLREIDNFYDYQMKEINDSDITQQIAKQGIIDGVAVAITSFDNDTLGTASLYRGFLKRQVLLFENTFWENPYCEDEQDQQYWGYFFPMDIKSIKELCEDHLTDEEKEEFIIPDEFYNLSETDQTKVRNDIDNEVANVYVRFFRVDGEVFFELATKYVDLYEVPHSLNPKTNQAIMKKLKQDLEKRMQNDEEDVNKKVIDYATDGAKYLLFTRAEKTSAAEHAKEKSKFWRYPVSIFRPYPIVGSILGESGASQIIANQKIINYTFLLIILIMQSHAMPKILAKEEALRGQEYDNSPNQILIDYTPVTSGVQWGITRLSSGDAVNSNLIEIGQKIIGLTRNINGFDDLISNASKDLSGYAYQQLVQQANLTLQQPQKRLWKYIKENARTDLLYFKHYIDKAKYFTRMSNSDVEANENYRLMAQNMITADKVEGVEPTTVLPETRQNVSKDIDNSYFDNDFNVIVDVEQGIAGSEISESQHYKEVFQYIASGNIDVDKIKLWVMNDPAFSTKTKQRLMKSFEVLENSQLQIKNQEIAELQKIIQTLMNNIKSMENNVSLLKTRDQAREKAMKQQMELNKAAVEAFAQGSGQIMSESEVKAQNAKGISGGKFDTNP
ncbi:MAG: hypothetical protein M0Q41_10760 [Bacteroidales bacterium]|nr:hypothetical protein [Bacteroidales bacterium]